MPTLSVALIVKNEAAWIPDCLASVREVADQVVVVDTGSTDGTAELAASLGAEVHVFPWVDDFSAARNESLRHCTGDWVLVLDADEELAAGSHDALRACMAQDAIHAFRIRILNYFDSGKFTSLDMVTRPNDQTHPKAARFDLVADFHALRLFRRHAWVAYRGRIHELVDDVFEEHGYPIQKADVDLHHFGKVLADREQHKRSFYMGLATRDAAEFPGNKQVQFNLMIQALVAQEWQIACDAAWAYTRLTKDLPPMVLYGGGVAMQHLQRHQEALGWFTALTRARPDHSAAWTRQGVTLAAMGRLDEARASLAKAIETGPTYALAYLNTAEMHLAQGRLEDCRLILEKGLQQLPKEESLWAPLVELGIREGSLQHASRDASRALRVLPQGGGGLWHRLVVLGLLEQGAEGPAQQVLNLGLQAFPDHPDLLSLAARLGLAH